MTKIRLTLASLLFTVSLFASVAAIACSGSDSSSEATNAAAGVVVGQIGAANVDREELEAELTRLVNTGLFKN